MKRLLKRLCILQERVIEVKITKKVDGSSKPIERTQRRLNPFNPLTYVVISIGFLLAVLMFGIIGWKEEFDWHKELKWK